MSNFSVFTPLTGGRAGTAPDIFSASTPDNLATVEGVGYMNDMKKTVDNNDIIYVNYSDATTPTFQRFRVSVSGGNYNLVVSNDAHATTTSVTGSTATVVDPAITANSVVVGNLITSTNPASVQKIDPIAGGFAVTFNTDPGASEFAYISFPVPQ